MRRWGWQVGLISAVAVSSVGAVSFAVLQQATHPSTPTAEEQAFNDRIADALLGQVLARSGGYSVAGWATEAGPLPQDSRSSGEQTTVFWSSGSWATPSTPGEVSVPRPAQQLFSEPSSEGEGCRAWACYLPPGLWMAQESGKVRGGPPAAARLLEREAPFAWMGLGAGRVFTDALLLIPDLLSETVREMTSAGFEAPVTLEREEALSEGAAARQTSPSRPAESALFPGLDVNAEPARSLEALVASPSLNGDWIGEQSAPNAVFEAVLSETPPDRPAGRRELPGLQSETPELSAPGLQAAGRDAAPPFSAAGQAEAPVVLELTTTTAPEPVTLWLLATGLIAISIVDMQRRRFRR